MLHGPVAQPAFDEHIGGSHCTTALAVPKGHVPPSGIAPSPTVTVKVTAPGVVHVKLVLAELGAENVPLGADHAYVSALGFTEVAVANALTEPPTVVSLGMSESDSAVIDAHE
jgi:hypothetical protein